MIEVNKCYIDMIKEWIKHTEDANYIDVTPLHDDEFDFIVGMAKNLLKELEK